MNMTETGAYLIFTRIAWVDFTKVIVRGVTILSLDGIDSIVTLYQQGTEPIGSTITMKSGIEHTVSQSPQQILEVMKEARSMIK